MNAVDVLQYGHQTVLDTVEGLAEADWDTPGVTTVWSVKDVIGHLGAFELVLVDVLASIVGTQGPMPHLDKFRNEHETFNDTEVAARKSKSVGEVFGEYKQAHERVMEFAQKISPEKFRENGTLPWYGLGYSLDDFIVYSYYAHKREHCGQIKVFRKRTEV